LASHKTANGTEHIPLGCVEKTIIVRLPVNSQ
jgi:hypothetical protein